MLKRPFLLAAVLVLALFGAGKATGQDVLVALALLLAAGAILAYIVVGIRGSFAEFAERRRIWEQGQPARAKVVAIRSIGASTSTQMINFDLEVHPPGGAPYRAKTFMYIDQLAIPRIQPGCEIEIRIDRTDPRRVVVDASLTPNGYI